MNKRKPRPYIDRGKPGQLRYRGDVLLTARDPLPVPARRKLTPEMLRRHNTLEPELEETHRMFLRWTEGEGSGLPNADAEVREMHYDPLPVEVQRRVSAIVESSPWRELIHILYFATLTGHGIAEQLGISRAQLYADRRAALWFFKGRFWAEKISMLASPKRARISSGIW